MTPPRNGLNLESRCFNHLHIRYLRIRFSSLIIESEVHKTEPLSLSTQDGLRGKFKLLQIHFSSGVKLRDITANYISFSGK